MIEYRIIKMNSKAIILTIILIAAIATGAAVFILLNKPVEEKAPINFEECVLAGNPVQESYPRQCRTPEGQIFSENIGNELEKINLIRIDAPRPNQSISSPLIVKGQARGNWFFEASFPVKLYDESNQLLVLGVAQAQGNWMTEDFVSFEARLEFTSPGAGQGTLRLEKDNPSGLPENDDALIVPIRFGAAEEASKVKIYFNNSRLDPEASCNKVFPAERAVSKTAAIARAAVEELLKGPIQAEKDSGFFTSLNSGVKIQNLTIVNGVARVDFDGQLEFQVGGSCRVAAIRSQITETLKQFPSVGDVVISINGRTEDILQP